MSESENTSNEEVYFDTRSEANLQRHVNARKLIAVFNSTTPDHPLERATILNELFAACGDGVWIEPPFYCDYGDNITIGDGVFANFNCVFLDGDSISIGEGSLLGPSVQIYTTTHPIRPDERINTQSGMPAYHSTTKPVSIGRFTWIGGGTVILPGVSIGDGTTIGAGSVVTNSVPDNVLAAGNPCRIIRPL